MKRIAKNLYQHENGTYYSLHRRGSRQFKKSLGTKDRASAKAILRQTQMIGAGGASPVPLAAPGLTIVSRPPFPAAVEEHERNTAFASAATGRNLRTRKATMLRFCSDWSEFQPVSIWKRFDAEGWVSAQNQLRWYLRSFSEFLCSTRLAHRVRSGRQNSGENCSSPACPDSKSTARHRLAINVRSRE